MFTTKHILLSLLLNVLTLAQNTGVDSAAGASGGDQGAYSLSRGGLIAIIVVVVLFAVFGIGSAVLFYVAKKRQWEVRKSIKRASRRITSKLESSRKSAARERDVRQSRRHGTVRLQSPPRSSRPRDLEKGEGKKVTHTLEVEEPTKDKKWKAIIPESWSIGARGAATHVQDGAPLDK